MSNFAARLTGFMERATKGEWSVPHLCRDDIDCNCASIIAEGYMGGIGEIWVNNGISSITEGGNDCPPLSEAKANGHLIAFLVNHAPAIRDLVAAAEKSVKTGTTASRNELEAALAKLEEA